MVSSPRSRCASGFLVLLPRYARRSPARHRCPQFLWRAYMEFLSNLCPALSNPASSSFPISPPPLAILGGAALGSDGEQGEEGRCTEEDCFFSKRSNHGAATTCCCVAPNYHGAPTTTSCCAPPRPPPYAAWFQNSHAGIHGGQATSTNPWYIAPTNL